MDSEYDYYEKDPCDDCENSENCDFWEARFCCHRCLILGMDDCGNCDPWDI